MAGRFAMSIAFISFNPYFAGTKLDAQGRLRTLTALLCSESNTKIALSPTEGKLIWTIFAGQVRRRMRIFPERIPT